jgi:hypothetical protein
VVRTAITCGVSFALASLSSGCITFLGPLSLQRTLSREQGVRLEREFGIGVDGVTVGLASCFVGAPLPFGSVMGADVGVYRVVGPEQPRLQELNLSGWERVARVREPDGEFVVFLKMGRSSIRGLAIFNRSEDEVTIARVVGRIDKLFDWAVKHGGGFRLDPETSSDPSEPDSANPFFWLGPSRPAPAAHEPDVEDVSVSCLADAA